MKTVYFCLMLIMVFLIDESQGQDSISTLAHVKMKFDYDLPDKVDSGFFCLVLHGHSYRSKYQIRLMQFISEIDFSQVKDYKDSLYPSTDSRWRRFLSPFLFHPAHNPKAYLMIPIDNSFVTGSAFTITIERKRFFGMIRQSTSCEVSFQPERIYLLVGPHSPNQYSCGWSGNIRTVAE